MLEVNASAVLRYEGDGTASVVGRHNRDGIASFPIGARLPADERTSIGRVLASGAPARIDDWGAVTGDFAETMLQIGYRSTVAAPIVVAGTLWGAVSIASEDPLPPESEARLGAFCELVSLAVASAQARADLRASRARVVKAGDEQRRQARAQPARRRAAAARRGGAHAPDRAGAAELASRARQASCWRRRRGSSTRACRSCASSPAGSIPAP